MNPLRSLERTPVLASRIASLRRALRSAAWADGLASLCLAVGLWLAWCFLADWGLRVPTWVRWLHTLALLALVGACAWRRLVRPLRSQPDARGLALLLERAHGGRDELLVTAVELQSRPGPPGPLGERVLQQADFAARELAYRRALDLRPVALRSGLALLLLCGWAAFVGFEPGLAERFGRRLLGAASAWPQRTVLELELACADAGARIEREPALVRALVPKGARVDVSARVVGRDPQSVALVAADGTRRALARSGPGLYRASLSGLRSGFEGWLEGGDDTDHAPLLRIEVQEPPDVASLAVVIEPPAYTREALRIEPSGSARVPAGSRVRVHVRGIGPALRGSLLVEGGSDEYPLLPQPYPASGSALAVPPTAPAATAAPATAAATAAASASASAPAGHVEWACEFELSRTLRYRVALVDAHGLSNPSPGLNVLEVQSDRPPRVEWLNPQASELAISAAGALRLRARATDDWFVQALAYEFKQQKQVGATAGTVTEPVELALQALDAGTDGAADGGRNAAAASDALRLDDGGAAAQPRLQRALASTLIEASALGVLTPGERYELVLRARDGREPAPQEARSSALRLVVLTPQELLRGVQDDLARPRTHAEALLKRMRERAARVEELVAGLSEGGALETADAQAATAVLASLRRSRTDAAQLFHELAELAERVIYARVDEVSTPLLARLDALQSEPALPGPSPRDWRMLCDMRRADGGGDGGAAAPLVDLVGLALDIDLPQLAPAELVLRDALPRAQSGGLLEALQRVAAADARAQAVLEQLLDRISEWDNYQAVLGLTRDILERQRALRERTRAESTRR
jgi:hypothetical protein